MASAIERLSRIELSSDSQALSGSSINAPGLAGCVEHNTGSFHGRERKEVTSMLLQSLSDLGYHRAAKQLSEEVSCGLEAPSVALFSDLEFSSDRNGAGFNHDRLGDAEEKAGQSRIPSGYHSQEDTFGTNSPKAKFTQHDFESCSELSMHKRLPNVDASKLPASETYACGIMAEVVPQVEDPCLAWFNADFDQSFDFGLDFGIDEYLNLNFDLSEQDLLVAAADPNVSHSRSANINTSTALAGAKIEDGIVRKGLSTAAGQHVCTICSKVYGDKRSLKRHHKSTHQKIQYICSQCGEDFTRSDTLSRHRAEQHEQSLSDAAAESKSKKIPCRICGSRVRSTGLVAHQASKMCRSSVSRRAVENTNESSPFEGLNDESSPRIGVEDVEYLDVNLTNASTAARRDSSELDIGKSSFTQVDRNEAAAESYASKVTPDLNPMNECRNDYLDLIKDFDIEAIEDATQGIETGFVESVDSKILDSTTTTGGDIDSPLYYDTIDTQATLFPCGHLSCVESFTKITDPAGERNNENRNGNETRYLCCQEPVGLRACQDAKATACRCIAYGCSTCIEAFHCMPETPFYAEDVKARRQPDGGVQRVRELICEKAVLDSSIWAWQGKHKFNLPPSICQRKEADDLLVRIYRIVRCWSGEDLDYREWREAERIKNWLGEPSEHTSWATLPPWKRYEAGAGAMQVKTLTASDENDSTELRMWIWTESSWTTNPQRRQRGWRT